MSDSEVVLTEKWFRGRGGPVVEWGTGKKVHIWALARHGTAREKEGGGGQRTAQGTTSAPQAHHRFAATAAWGSTKILSTSSVGARVGVQSAYSPGVFGLLRDISGPSPVFVCPDVNGIHRGRPTDRSDRVLRSTDALKSQVGEAAPRPFGHSAIAGYCGRSREGRGGTTSSRRRQRRGRTDCGQRAYLTLGGVTVHPKSMASRHGVTG